MIWHVGSNLDVIGNYHNSRWSNISILSALVLMAIASLVLFYSLIPR